MTTLMLSLKQPQKPYFQHFTSAAGQCLWTRTKHLSKCMQHPQLSLPVADRKIDYFAFSFWQFPLNLVRIGADEEQAAVFLLNKTQTFSHQTFPPHSSDLLSAVTEWMCVCVCMLVRETEAKARTWGQTLSTSTSLHVSLGWQPCVRVSALWSRWPSQLLPGSPGSQRSLTRAGVLTAWGPTDLLLWPGLWGLWGLLGAPRSSSRDSQDNRSVLTQLPPTTYQSP